MRASQGPSHANMSYACMSLCHCVIVSLCVLGFTSCVIPLLPLTSYLSLSQGWIDLRPYMDSGPFTLNERSTVQVNKAHTYMLGIAHDVTLATLWKLCKKIHIFYTTYMLLFAYIYYIKCCIFLYDINLILFFSTSTSHFCYCIVCFFFVFCLFLLDVAFFALFGDGTASV